MLRGEEEGKKRGNNSQFQQTKLDSRCRRCPNCNNFRWHKGLHSSNMTGVPLSCLFVLRGRKMKKHQNNSQFWHQNCIPSAKGAQIAAKPHNKILLTRVHPVLRCSAAGEQCEHEADTIVKASKRIHACMIRFDSIHIGGMHRNCGWWKK